MGFFRKRPGSQNDRPPWMRDGFKLSVSNGQERLEVVGESYYQEDIWQIVGGRTQERVSFEVVAGLIPEPKNPHDPNAIGVWISGLKVGHLSRVDAVKFLPGVLAMSRREGLPVGMYGTVIGGGSRPDGLGLLGVFLRYDPMDFGLVPSRVRESRPPTMLTGESEVFASGRLRWLNGLNSDTLVAIKQLRSLLQDVDNDPIERHYMFCELESRLYKSRETFGSALTEYDQAIREHDGEMDAVRSRLIGEIGQVPVFATYRQAAVRHQKANDAAGALWWARRGLELYGSDCSRSEAVEDLRQRARRYEAKIASPDSSGAREPAADQGALVVESLSCQVCGEQFERPRTRGRKPTQCPDCRERSG